MANDLALDGAEDQEIAATPATVRTEATSAGYTFTKSVYTAPTGGSVMELWLVAGMGHAWSGGGAAGSCTDAKGPDASAELVRFFREHPMGR